MMIKLKVEPKQKDVATKKARKSRKVNLKRVTENQIVGDEHDMSIYQ